MGLLSSVARGFRAPRRIYNLPVEDGLAARLVISPMAERTPTVRALQNVPVLGDIAEALAPKRDYVSWSFDAARDVINKPRTSKDKAKIGLAAMRRVMRAMEEDARKYAPRAYGYDPSNASLESLYSSLSNRAEKMGYAMRPSPYDTGMELTRQFDALSEKIGQDAALDALLYAGAGGAYLASR